MTPCFIYILHKSNTF